MLQRSISDANSNPPGISNGENLGKPEDRQLLPLPTKPPPRAQRRPPPPLPQNPNPTSPAQPSVPVLQSSAKLNTVATSQGL